jgi:mono/diheme cytochrome c family protein
MKTDRSAVWAAPLRFVTCLLVLVAFAAVALYAQFNSGDYSFRMPGSIHQMLLVPSMPGTNYSASAYLAFTPDLAPGDGRNEVQAYCNTCHSLGYITMQPPLPGATWAAEVDKMDKVFGGQFPADVHQRIVTYLQSHYTPETRKP